jgi:hypothetical protein
LDLKLLVVVKVEPNRALEGRRVYAQNLKKSREKNKYQLASKQSPRRQTCLCSKLKEKAEKKINISWHPPTCN